MGAGTAGGLDRIVDLDRYPVREPDGAEYAAVVRRVRRDLGTHGCSVVADFIRPQARESLREECAAVAPLAHRDVATVNVYNARVDPSWPADHPARIPLRRENAFVARTMIPPDAAVHRLYTDSAFQRFVAACFGLDRVHELADPLAGLCLNVLDPGTSHPWHFDINEFAVSLLTQGPERGGMFEYCPQIRSAADENFADVRNVLQGRGDHLVHRLALRPGDLQLFRGRYSLHRVGPVGGDRQRHTAIFSYSEWPDVVSTPERTRQLFGRLPPAGSAGAGPLVRGDRLLD